MYGSSTPPTGAPQRQPYPPQYDGATPRKPKHRGRFRRFIRGYLMIVGALSTLYVLVRLLVVLLVELNQWIPTIH